MSGLEGNPHAQPAINRRGQIIDAFSEGGSNTVPNTLALAQLEATLSLAYEQRTANLIAIATMNPQWYGSTSQEAFDQIDARLGLNKKED